MTKNFEQMLLWCLDGVIVYQQMKEGEFNDQAVEELRSCIDDPLKMEAIKAYWEVLSYDDDSEEWAWVQEDGKHCKMTSYMIGWVKADEMFADTVKRFPELTKVLKVYMYS